MMVIINDGTSSGPRGGATKTVAAEEDRPEAAAGDGITAGETGTIPTEAAAETGTTEIPAVTTEVTGEESEDTLRSLRHGDRTCLRPTRG